MSGHDHGSLGWLPGKIGESYRVGLCVFNWQLNEGLWCVSDGKN